MRTPKLHTSLADEKIWLVIDSTAIHRTGRASDDCKINKLNADYIMTALVHHNLVFCVLWWFHLFQIQQPFLIHDVKEHNLNK